MKESRVIIFQLKLLSLALKTNIRIFILCLVRID